MAEENLLRSQRVATSLTGDHAAWRSLSEAGFSRVEQLVSEFGKPHQVGYLFDTAAQCLEVVKGLHGADYVLHEALKDCEVLFDSSGAMIT